MKRKIKSFIIGFVVSGVVCGVGGAIAAPMLYEAYINRFPIYLNGEQLALRGYSINGNTYFQLRHISDNIGDFDVEFVDNTICISTNGYDYLLEAEKQAAMNNLKLHIKNSNSQYNQYISFFVDEKITGFMYDINGKIIHIENGYYVYATYVENGVTKMDQFVVHEQGDCYLIEEGIRSEG